MPRTLAEIIAGRQRMKALKAKAQEPRKIAILEQPDGDYACAGHLFVLMQETRERDARCVADPAPAPDRIISNGRLSRVLRAEAQAQGLPRDRNDRRRYFEHGVARRYDPKLDVWVRL